MATLRKKQDVLDVMRRIGIHPEQIAKAQATLPDPVDLDADGDQLADLGISVDKVYNSLGIEM